MIDWYCLQTRWYLRGISCYFYPKGDRGGGLHFAPLQQLKDTDGKIKGRFQCLGSIWIWCGSGSWIRTKKWIQIRVQVINWFYWFVVHKNFQFFSFFFEKSYLQYLVNIMHHGFSIFCNELIFYLSSLSVISLSSCSFWITFSSFLVT